MHTEDEPLLDLLSRLRYQIFRPAVTTVSICAAGCGLTARGGGRCAVCLEKQIAERLPDMLKTQLHEFAFHGRLSQSRWYNLEIFAYDLDSARDDAGTTPHP